VIAQVAGYHGVLPMASIPFGVGVALSEPGSRIIKSRLQRIRVRVRRDQ
jgi:hypothetical protein